MKALTALCLACFATIALAQESGPQLTLESAIAQAIALDPWLNGSRYREDALNNESISASTLPDPKINLAAANFPTNTFDINQEAMTQLTVGISQMFPRGNSLALSSRQKLELAAQEPLLRQDRRAKITATVTKLWLEAIKAQESIRLINQDRSLFEHLVDATRASYSSAIGPARQQDIIRAQLELTRLDDRLTVLHQQLESAQQRLSQWIGAQAHLPAKPISTGEDPSTVSFHVMNMLNITESDRQRLVWINQHPAMQAFDRRINSMQTGVELARQKYRPEWAFSAQYSYRDDDLLARDRADLFSLGVTFDLPLFTANRQDKEVSAAISRAEALKTDKLLMSRQLLAQHDTTVAQLKRLQERHALYEQRLLPQMSEQAEAALTAYNNDEADFAEAVRAHIAELNAKIDFLNIQIDRLQTIAELNYFLTAAHHANAEGFAQ